MKQVFRLMGLPDKIIAFDELPEDLVKGFEMIKAEGFPKAWKTWMGEREITIKIPSELNPVTGQRRIFEPVVEKDSYFYLVDWNVKPVVEKWKQIEEYVRAKVPTEFRLTDKLEDMAKPLAPDKVSGITLEPDEVVVIPIPKETKVVTEIKPRQVVKETPLIQVVQKEQRAKIKCGEPGCDREFDDGRGIRLHKMKKHPIKEVVALS